MPAGMLYRWEDSNHGLEHKCGTCATVLSSPRAKKTCLGVHEEVCTRYHKTLFYVGQSHHCDACHKTIELHDKRHREIVTLIHEVQSLDGSTSQLFNRKGKGKKKNNPKLELKDLERDLRDADDDEQEVDWDNISSTLNEEDAEEERKQVWNDADARKAAKTERKVAKNQLRFDVITKEDLDRVQNALHPAELNDSVYQPSQVSNGQGLFDNSTIDKNIAFNANCFRWSSLRHGAHEKKILKNNGPPKNLDLKNTEQVEEMSTSILKKLGIRVNVAKAAKARKALDSKLRSAILNDLVASENEQAETMQRMAGYWRYVNKRTYNQMVENNELWDWATGAKLPKIEEYELDVIEEEDESVDEGTLEGSTPGITPMTSPETCWDEFYELGPDDVPLFPKISAYEEDDGIKTPTQATYARPSINHRTPAKKTGIDFEHLQKQGLTYSPGRSPGPTNTFNVPSPSSSDDEPFNGDWDYTESPSGKGHIVAKVSNTSKVSFFPKTPNANGRTFNGKKDTRTLNKAVFIREASPPQTKDSEASPWGKAPSPTTILPSSRDVNNHFGNLDRDIPAPCDDQKVPDTSLKFKVLNIALPPKKPSPTVEEGWQLQGAKRAGKKNKTDYPPLPKAQKPAQVAKKVPAKPTKKPAIPGNPLKANPTGATWASVAAGRPKKK